MSSQALEEMNGKELEGEAIEIVFAKPPDQKRKERKAQRQAAKTVMYEENTNPSWFIENENCYKLQDILSDTND